MAPIDTSEYLQICRYDNGIKLLRPNRKLTAYTSVGSLLNLPFQVYFENTEQETQQSNEIYSERNGFASHTEALSAKWFKPFKEKTIQPTIMNDKNVIAHNKYIIVEEEGIRMDETTVHTLSIRMPWYGEDNRIVGLFGFSISIGLAPLAESLLQISELGLLNSVNQTQHGIGREVNNVYLSRRQLECGKLILAGLTAKEIGVALNLSTRTVEGYINVIRTKLACYNRSELIMKLSELL